MSIFIRLKENGKIARLDNNFGFKVKKLEEVREMVYQMFNLSKLIEEKGIEQGIKQGIEQGIKKTAKRMLDFGLDMGMIIQCTDLSEEQIEALKQEMESEKSSLSDMSLL